MDQECRAASDCDVKIINVNSVEIEDDKITINAEVSVGIAIITPELPNDGKSRRFIGWYCICHTACNASALSVLSTYSSNA